METSDRSRKYGPASARFNRGSPREVADLPSSGRAKATFSSLCAIFRIPLFTIPCRSWSRSNDDSRALPTREIYVAIFKFAIRLSERFRNNYMGCGVNSSLYTESVVLRTTIVDMTKYGWRNSIYKHPFRANTFLRQVKHIYTFRHLTIKIFERKKCLSINFVSHIQLVISTIFFSMHMYPTVSFYIQFFIIPYNQFKNRKDSRKRRIINSPMLSTSVIQKEKITQR